MKHLQITGPRLSTMSADITTFCTKRLTCTCVQFLRTFPSGMEFDTFILIDGISWMFFLLVQLLLPAHCTYRGLLLHLITLYNTDRQSVELVWTRDRPVAETATCTTHNTHKRHTSMPPLDSNPQSQQASGRRPKP